MISAKQQRTILSVLPKKSGMTLAGCRIISAETYDRLFGRLQPGLRKFHSGGMIFRLTEREIVLMKRTAFLFIFLFVAAAGLHAFRLNAGVVLPVSLGLNFAGTAGVWPGLIYGGGLTAGADFLENQIASGTRFSAAGYGLVSMDSYFLPEDKFAAGSRIVFYNLRYGADVRFHFLENIFFGLGPQFLYAFQGSYGTSELLTNFTTNMTGLDIYLTLSGGYEFRILGRALTLPVQARISYDLTVPNAHVFEFGVAAALVWSWELWPDLPPAPRAPETNTVKPVPVRQTPAAPTNAVVPLKRYTLSEIQKLPVTEIILTAEAAMERNDRDYAQLLVREGLVKEPDNTRLLELLSRLISR